VVFSAASRMEHAVIDDELIGGAQPSPHTTRRAPQRQQNQAGGGTRASTSTAAQPPVRRRSRNRCAACGSEKPQKFRLPSETDVRWCADCPGRPAEALPRRTTAAERQKEYRLRLRAAKEAQEAGEQAAAAGAASTPGSSDGHALEPPAVSGSRRRRRTSAAADGGDAAEGAGPTRKAPRQAAGARNPWAGLCSMCSTPGGKQMVMLPCHHMACRECMLRNLTEGPKAPLCHVCHPHKMCVCGADKATFWISGTGPGYKVKLWCKDCRPAEAIDKAKTSKGRLCVCHKTRPRFGLPGQDQSEAQWCSKCRPDGAVDLARRPDQPVTIKACRCGSGRVPTLGLVDSSGKSVFRGPQKWCTRCPDIPPDAFPVGKWRCECGRKQASLGLPGGGPSNMRWCIKCPSKPANAVSPWHKPCRCGATKPTYAPRGATTVKEAVWCTKCPDRPDDAVCFAKKVRCVCGEGVPMYALPDDTQGYKMKPKPIWCWQCPEKPAEAVNVRIKRCECGAVRAWLADPGCSALKYCAQCPNKPDGAHEPQITMKRLRASQGTTPPWAPPPGRPPQQQQLYL